MSILCNPWGTVVSYPIKCHVLESNASEPKSQKQQEARDLRYAEPWE